MKRLVKLGMNFCNGDVIEIPREEIIYFNVFNVQTYLCFCKSVIVEDKKDISEYEVAEKFEIALLTEWLDNNRIDYTDFEQDAELEIAIDNGEEYKETVENLTYKQRIKKYKDLIGITQIFNDGTERCIEISVLKEWLYNNRSDYIPDEQNMDIVKNLSYIERIKNYNNMAGVALRYNDGTERTIGIGDTNKIIEEENSITTIKIGKIKN